MLFHNNANLWFVFWRIVALHAVADFHWFEIWLCGAAYTAESQACGIAYTANFFKVFFSASQSWDAAQKHLRVPRLKNLVSVSL